MEGNESTAPPQAKRRSMHRSNPPPKIRQGGSARRHRDLSKKGRARKGRVDISLLARTWFLFAPISISRARHPYLMRGSWGVKEIAKARQRTLPLLSEEMDTHGVWIDLSGAWGILWND
jgi:hypothetical protein